MKFKDQEHLAEIIRVETLWSGLRVLADLAQKHGIDDIFQDNGAKILQQAVMMNFKLLPGREGNDAVDEEGREWEMKSANVAKVSGFTTHHHLNHVILSKMRLVPWLFSCYHHIELTEIYVMTPEQLEPWFQAWQARLDGTFMKKGVLQPAVASINNPKIPVKFVRDNGVLIYHQAEKILLNPIDVFKRTEGITTQVSAVKLPEGT